MRNAVAKGGRPSTDKRQVIADVLLDNTAQLCAHFPQRSSDDSQRGLCLDSTRHPPGRVPAQREHEGRPNHPCVWYEELFDYSVVPVVNELLASRKWIIRYLALHLLMCCDIALERVTLSNTPLSPYRKAYTTPTRTTQRCWREIAISMTKVTRVPPSTRLFRHNLLIGSEKAAHLTVEEIIIEDLRPTFHALRTVDPHATYST